MNTELMMRVARQIESHPDNFDIRHWFRHGHNGYHLVIPAELDQIRDAAREGVCGTTACIAGWAVIEADMDLSGHYEVSETAQALLGLDALTANKLFMEASSYWAEMMSGPGDTLAVLPKVPAVMAAQVLRFLAIFGHLPSREELDAAVFA